MFSRIARGSKDGVSVHSALMLFLAFLLSIVCLGSMTGCSGSSTSNSTDSSSSSKSTEKAEVAVVDFSTMDKAAIQNWCDQNKVKCNITEDYSDTVAKGGFVSQSVAAGTSVKEGEKINIVFSLGKQPTTEEKNALKQAEQYSKTMNMSKQGIYDQLVSEYGGKFPAEAAQYAIDNVDADWKANALAKAKSYQETMSMSSSAIYDQLVSEYGEKFTAEEAQYAIDNLG